MCQQEWVRKLNNHGNSIGTSKFLVEIDPYRMIQIATEITGLNDFGDENWQQNYHGYIKKLNELDQLHTLGRIRIKTALLIALRNRLLVTEKIKQEPAILADSINNPLFIIGLPRTGTTLLYNLLALNPVFRTPLGYEAVAPVFRPINSTVGINRSDIAECLFDFEIDINNQVEAMHNHRQNLPIECQNIMTNVLALFYSETIGDSNPSEINNYSLPDYKWHKKVLQVLQYEGTSKTWLLKCPSHINNMEQLIKVYPKSRIIHTHRNPMSVIPSCARLLKYFIDSHCKSHHFERTLETFINTLEIGLRETIDQRESSIIKASSIQDTYFDQLLKNPISCLKEIYNYFDIPFSQEIKTNALKYLKANPRYSKGKYSCSFEDFGLSKEHIYQQFKFYTDHYNINTDPNYVI